MAYEDNGSLKSKLKMSTNYSREAISYDCSASEAKRKVARPAAKAITTTVEEQPKVTEICKICLIDVSETKGYSICKKNHYMCVDCIFLHSKDKHVLSCFCNRIVSFYNMNFNNEISKKRFLMEYLSYYEQKYNDSIIEIENNKVSIYFAGEIEAQLSKIRHKLIPLAEKYSEKYKLLTHDNNDSVIIKNYTATIRKIPIKCISNACEGKIDQNNKCDTCNITICNDCEDIKHDGPCNPDTLKTIQLMEKDDDFITCPFCSTRIKKEDGCPNIVCRCGNSMNMIDIKYNPYWKNDLYGKMKQVNLRNNLLSKKYKKDCFTEFMKYIIIPNECPNNHKATIYYREFSKLICRLIRRTNKKTL